MGATFTYVVIIPYREPTYELKRGGPPGEPYTSRYTVHAADPEDAISQAVEQFNLTARNSSVGWSREIDLAAVRVEKMA